ncbi:MAG: alpha-L-fucosidase [Bacteroidales bacterium]|nr:alpha-L-fucosidase [Bacteroidales bacterium]
MKRYYFLFVCMFLSMNVFCQNNERKITLDEQLADTSSIIKNKISQWQDLKFGFLIHWGIYSQWGVVESWSICNESWIDRKNQPYEPYKQKYFALNKTFNPKNFKPQLWAKIAKDAGMKYVIFTTKHHDGFCMFNTKQTTYSCCDSSCPNSKNTNSDITKQVVDAFRNDGFWTGLYFSKPDWHNENYWSLLWATPDRNVNYDIDKHKDMWQKYCDYTFNQIKELTHNYGKIDILWLDGGWIRPQWSIKTDEIKSWLGAYKRVQDVNMPKIASMARENNKDLIIVDRSVGGKYENYQTPEQQVPDTLLSYPWETCMTMGDSWSYVPNDNYKSVNNLIHILVDVVCKGGNFLLNVGPDANGNLPQEAINRMEAIGKWLKVNGEAIYNTRPIYPYKDNGVCFTKNNNGKEYAIILIDTTNKLKNDYVFSFSDKLKSGNKKVLGQKDKAQLIKQGDKYSLKFSDAFVRNNQNKDAIVVAL